MIRFMNHAGRQPEGTAVIMLITPPRFERTQVNTVNSDKRQNILRARICDP